MSFLKRKKNMPEQGRTQREPVSRGNAPVFSYYSKRSGETEVRSRSQQMETKRTRDRSLWLKYFPLLLSLGIVLLAAAYLTTLSTSPRVTIERNKDRLTVTQPTHVYETAAATILQRSLFNQSKLTINTDEVADALKAQFPELGDLVVTIPLIGRKPVIQTQPSTPSLILTGQSGSFIIDDNGRAVLASNQLASSIRDKLPVVSDGSEANVELGKQILTTDLVAFVTALQHQFAAKNTRVESYSFPALANELHVKVAGEGYYIKFNTDIDARQQIGTYIAVKERLENDNKLPSEYIDVRVEERAYIK